MLQVSVVKSPSPTKNSEPDAQWIALKIDGTSNLTSSCVKRPILLTGSFRFIHGHENDSVSFILPLIILSYYHMYIISPDN